MAEWVEAHLQGHAESFPGVQPRWAQSGALTLVNERCADYLALAKDHPLRSGIGTCAAWDSNSPFSIQMITKRGKSGRTVQAPAARANWASRS